MNSIEISKMSRIERLQTMEEIWDSLIHEDSEIESPDWHLGIIERRKRDIKEGKANFLSIEEVKSNHHR
jgi:putative addiction module component (TIGR02574 family)